jgi:hypothetical protein
MKDKAENSVIARCYTPSPEAFKIELLVEKHCMVLLYQLNVLK